MLIYPHLSFSLQPTKGMRSALLIETNFPELAPENIEEHELPQKNDYFYLSETVFRVGLHALLGEVLEIMPHHVIFIHNVVQVELVVDYFTKAVLVEVPVVVELGFAQLLRDRRHCLHGFRVRQKVTFS